MNGGVTATLLALATLLPVAAAAQSAENVAVVINDASPESQRIGEYYVRKRSVPSANVIRIRTAAEETTDRAAYVATIEEPISASIRRQSLHDRILYIVLTKGIPIRISGTDGAEGTGSSVDSELTLLYRRMTGAAVPVRGRVGNPYYLGTKRVRDALPFTHREQDIFLVSRLDAFTVDEALALVDRGQTAVQDGRIVLDARGASAATTADAWLEEAARRLADLGQGNRVVLEQTARGARNVDNVLGYYSWGSNDDANRVRQFGMKFVPGALASTFVGTDGRTFQNPPDTWQPTGNWNDRNGWFAGSPETLAGDLIRAGVTGVVGHVTEPSLQSTIRPEILFPTYLAGFNLVEAFYLALPHLSWQAVVIGDPLCAPFARKVLTRSDIEDSADADTEMPGLFSRRRLEGLRSRVVAKEAPVRVSSLTLRAESRVARGDIAGALEALMEAAQIAPGLTSVQMQLAMLYEQAGQPTTALEIYRRVVAIQPNNAAALNNLAYGLAVHDKAYTEALPLARKAVSIAPAEPLLLDTLGWILHLMGNDAEAAKTLTAAVRTAPRSAEIRLHAAIIYAATGAVAAADLQLTEALKLDPTLEKRADVQQLKIRLAKP